MYEDIRNFLYATVNLVTEFLESKKTPLEIAEDMQATLIPSKEMIKIIEKQYNLEIACYIKQKDGIGGDTFKIIPIDNNLCIFSLADFSSHSAHVLIDTMLFNSLFMQLPNAKDIEESVTLLNTKLYQMLPRGNYATMFYGCFNKNSEVINYTTAGCPDAILLQDVEKHTLSGKGFPIGVKDDSEYLSKEIKFQNGNTIILYTDGLVETTVKNTTPSRFWTINDVINSISSSNSSAQDILDEIISKFRNQCNTARDDLTLLIIKHKKLLE